MKITIPKEDFLLESDLARKELEEQAKLKMKEVKKEVIEVLREKISGKKAPKFSKRNTWEKKSVTLHGKQLCWSYILTKTYFGVASVTYGGIAINLTEEEGEYICNVK